MLVSNKNVQTLPKSFGTLPRARRYVHSRTCEPLLPFEVDEDSEEEVDEEWLHDRTEMLLDEFEDVSEKERKIMKFWNRHVRFYNKTQQLTDLVVPHLCELFIRENRQVLIPFRRELLMHLLNLWDSGLITQEKIHKCIQILDNREYNLEPKF